MLPSYLNRILREAQSKFKGLHGGLLHVGSILIPVSSGGKKFATTRYISKSASDPSLDSTTGDLTAMSPSKDLRLYGEQMINLWYWCLYFRQPSEGQNSELPLFWHCKNGSFSILGGGGAVWPHCSNLEKPTSIQAISRKIKNLYRVKQDSCEILSTHPPPSLFVEDI